MIKAYKFRIYPTAKQERALNQTLRTCQELYNAALQERRDAYKLAGVSITYQEQQNQLPEIKKDRPDLKEVHSLVLQDVLRRLDRAMQAFFRRVANGEKPGFPRFRAISRYDSFTYTQSGVDIKNGKLVLSKIGHIKIKQHRLIDGKIKTCTIRRSATGKWFVCFSVKVAAKQLPASIDAAGVDAGLSSLLTLSDGTKVDAPQFFRQEEKALAKEQRKLAKLAKGSKERNKQRRVVARVHERITNKRANYAHHVSKQLVLMFGIIVFEDLSIRNMVKNHHLAKSISDAAWNQIVMFTTYKAESAGRKVISVDPRNTSQLCSQCHKKVEKSLSVRVHDCPHCGLKLDRDHNAALNILGLGLQTLCTTVQ
jgi:putative transposase